MRKEVKMAHEEGIRIVQVAQAGSGHTRVVDGGPLRLWTWENLEELLE